MASPDVSDLVDLTLYDKGPFELVDRALADAIPKLPGWTPREGNTELVILEGQGLIVAELIYAVNRLPGAVLDAQLRFMGLTRNLGAAPTAVVRFALGDILGHQLPAGTRVLLDLGGTSDPLVFQTDAAVVAPAGTSELDVPVTATRSTAVANGVPDGTVLVILDQIPYLNSAAIAPGGNPTAGVDEEAEVDWRARGRTLFATLRSTLVHAVDFTAEALNFPGVYRATTLDDYNPGAGGAPGDHPGHVTVAVLGAGNVALSGAAKDELLAILDSKALASLTIHVVDPTITPVDVTATVHRFETSDHDDTHDAVVAALEAYLNTDSWQWEDTVRVSALNALMYAAAGVRYVEVIDDPLVDVALPGVAPLATAGTFDITVNP
jgi:uncharacterized phage protein gp47/JayE